MPQAKELRQMAMQIESYGELKDIVTSYVAEHETEGLRLTAIHREEYR